MVKSLKIILRRFQNRKSPRKVKKVTLITVTLLFLGLISANEELDQKFNLEGYWFAIYPSSYEEAVKVVKEGRNYVATQTIGNDYIPAGEISFEMDDAFQNCKGQIAGRDFTNPSFIDCELVSVNNDLLVLEVKSNGLKSIFYKDIPSSNGSFCISDFREKLPEKGIEKILELRPKAFKHCLACEGSACRIKIWPKGRESESLICKKLFCKPVKAIEKYISSEDVLNVGSGATSVQFTFIINKKGNIDNLNITSYDGAMNRKQVKTFTRNILSSLEYMPVEINEKVYEIHNLRGWLYWSIRDDG